MEPFTISEMTVKIIEQKCEPFVGQRPAPNFWGRCERLNNKISDKILSSLKMFNSNEWGNYKYSFRSSLFSVHDFRSYLFLPFVCIVIYLNRILHKLYLFGLIYIKQGFKVFWLVSQWLLLPFLDMLRNQLQKKGGGKGQNYHR